jgi:hypothetical protein
VPGRIVELHDVESGALAGVGGEHSGAAAVPDDRDPVAARQRRQVEQRRDVEQVGE